MTNVTKLIQASLKKRHNAEKRFQFYGIMGITLAVLFLLVILISIFNEGKNAFKSTYIKLDVYFDEKIVDPEGMRRINDLKFADYKKLITTSLKKYFPEVNDKKELRSLGEFISSSEEQNLMNFVISNNEYIGNSKSIWLLASSTIDVIHKNPDMQSLSEDDRLISDRELSWFNNFKENGDIKFGLNKNFFLKADSTEPEQAGILGSVIGTFFTLFITLLLSFPIAVAAGVFL